MRIALCNEVIAAMPFERQCAFARSVGYDAIEIAPFTLTDDPARLPTAQAATWRRAATDAGIAITSLHYLLRAPSGLSITTSDAGQRHRTVDVMRALCGLAADLGARVLVHGSPDQRALAAGEEDDGRKRGIDCFAAVAEAAAQARVVYCIEPLSRHQTQFVNTGVANQLQQFFDKGLAAKDTSAARRADLKSRLATLNENETKTLIGLCSQAKDQPCIQAAAAHLKALRGGPW